MSSISFNDATLYVRDHRQFEVRLYFCYTGIFPVDALFSTQENWEEYDLTRDDSPLRYVVWSQCLRSVDQLFIEATKTLTLACKQSSILSSAAMFDAAYGGHDGLYDEEIADQVYGAGGYLNGPVLTFDLNVMRTVTWCRLIMEIREKNLERIRQFTAT